LLGSADRDRRGRQGNHREIWRAAITRWVVRSLGEIIALIEMRAKAMQIAIFAQRYFDADDSEADQVAAPSINRINETVFRLCQRRPDLHRRHSPQQTRISIR
jgi:hypothetical protein